MTRLMSQRSIRFALGTLATCASLVLLAACSSESQATNAQGTDAVTGLQACSWPAAVDAANVTAGQCVAARARLSCKGSNGGGEECLSSDAMHCPDSNTTPGVTYSDCTNLCQPDEYALACGGPGPGPWPEPPAACRTLPSGPGGGTISCCPCE
jgi:hypothetical protein